VNLIRMTVIPLIASMIVVSVGGMTVSGALGRTVVRALAISIGLLAIAAVASLLVALPVFASMQIDQGAASVLQGPAAASPAPATPSSPTLAEGLRQRLCAHCPE